MNKDRMPIPINPLVDDVNLTSNFEDPGSNDVLKEVVAAAYCFASAANYIASGEKFLDNVKGMKILDKDSAVDIVTVLNAFELPCINKKKLKVTTNACVHRLSELSTIDPLSPNSTTPEFGDNHGATSDAGKPRCRRRRSPRILVVTMRRSIRTSRYQGSFTDFSIRHDRSARHGRRRHITGAKGQKSSVVISYGGVVQDDMGDYASDRPTSPATADTEDDVDFTSGLPTTPLADQPRAHIADRVVEDDDDADYDSDDADTIRLDLLRCVKIVESSVLDLRSKALEKGLEAYMESVKPGLKEKACWKALQQLLKLYVSTIQALADVNSIEQLWSMEKPEKEAKKELPIDPFIYLTKEEDAEVEIAFSSKSDTVLISDTKRDIIITGEILRCLKDGEWLNDEVINAYLKLLKEREKREPQKFLKCHFFDSRFHTLLVQEKYNFKAMKKWSSAKRVGYSLFDCDKIFVPIHKTNHWCVVVVNMKDKQFEYLDSLPRTNKKGGDKEVLDGNFMSKLCTYFCRVKDKGGKDNDMHYWKKIVVEDVPKQKNSDDCGMFMLKYIDFCCRGLEFCFNQSHMQYFRRRTAKEILNLRAD